MEAAAQAPADGSAVVGGETEATVHEAVDQTHKRLADLDREAELLAQVSGQERLGGSVTEGEVGVLPQACPDALGRAAGEQHLAVAADQAGDGVEGLAGGARDDRDAVRLTAGAAQAEAL